MFVYQFCEIAQMVECNASGLVQFLGIIKKGYAWLLDQGKNFIIWMWKTLKSKYVSLKSVLHDYFLADSETLTKE